MSLELSRPLAVDRIGSAPYGAEVTATEAECRALAARLRIPSVLALRCDFVLTRKPAFLHAQGILRARVVRECVVTLDEFETEIAERFTIRFVAEESEAAEIDPESEDEIPYRGTMIDLGEAAAEQLALTLDPYPRKPDAVTPAQADDPARPLAGLAALRRRREPG